MAMRDQKLIPSFQRPSSKVVIRRVGSYEQDLLSVMVESLAPFELQVKDKSVLLKPNLVSLDPKGLINTHPVVIAAARECFLRMGAARVLVGDGPALDRDTEAIVESIRLREHLGALGGTFVDLNIDDVQRVILPTRASRLKELYLPKTCMGVDLLVSMPKLKTHHWAGVTLSMKNMFGIVPGGCYGWPKNILHWAGIDRAILDLNVAAKPDFAIVDGIVGMEGNGPIQGRPKASGVLVFGNDPVAVDATCCRVMGLRPEGVTYLERAGTMLGHLQADKIQQVGESIVAVRQPFAVLPEFQRLIAP
ncbi:MAG: DUF362 domain-containing protein [Candidatus Acidiferrum sp.]|jgi:uncharacterized protein (DUF362 family)